MAIKDFYVNVLRGDSYVRLVRDSIKSNKTCCIPLSGLKSLSSAGEPSILYCLGLVGELSLLETYSCQGRYHKLTSSDIKPGESICPGFHDTSVGDVCGPHCIESALQDRTDGKAFQLALEEAVKKSPLANVIIYDSSSEIDNITRDTTVTLNCQAYKYTLRKN